MNDKEKSQIQENLSTLYLRLNGYFTTGFIIHSEENKILSEIDILAVRFPNHSQPDTEHNSSEFLEIPNCIDLIIGEVKSRRKSLQFNKSLRKNDPEVVWHKLLNWVGILNENEIVNIVPKIIELIETKPNSSLKRLKSLQVNERISLRPIIFSPEKK